MKDRLQEIGRDLHTKVREFFDQPLTADATPLDLLLAALDEAERRVQPAGRGRRLFPYNRIVIRIAGVHADRFAIEAVFASFDDRLRERFDELKVDRPALVTSEVELGPAGGTPALSAECIDDGTRPEPAAAPEARVSRITLTVVRGQCEQAEYTLDERRILLGRSAEPTDVYGQTRRNDVVFTEVRDGVNETVGRAHARIEVDEDTGHYLLFDEAGSNPTSIVRAGRTIKVTPRDPRGVRVQSGDQIQLGRAVLKVTL
jgi:hypothetical protein